MVSLVIYASVAATLLGLFAAWKGKGLVELHRGEEGAHLIEYALVAVLIVIVVIAVLRALGITIQGVFKRINDELTS